MNMKPAKRRTAALIILAPLILTVPSFGAGCDLQAMQRESTQNDSTVKDNSIALNDLPIIIIPTQSPEIPDSEPAAISDADPLPLGFVYTADIIPDVILEMRYYSTYNFVGDRIDGYILPVSIMTLEAAEALKKANDTLRAQGYAIKIFDSYRPEDAVAHFVRWGNDSEDIRMKEYFYPSLKKSDLFSGYIAKRSGHSRGSTIDLTIVEMKTGKEVDMGGPFDFFGDVSHHDSKLITAEQAANRLILKNAMTAAGFKAYSAEWWHYTLNNEPFSDKYFNFPVQ